MFPNPDGLKYMFTTSVIMVDAVSFVKWVAGPAHASPFGRIAVKVALAWAKYEDGWCNIPWKEIPMRGLLMAGGLAAVLAVPGAWSKPAAAQDDKTYDLRGPAPIKGQVLVSTMQLKIKDADTTLKLMGQTLNLKMTMNMIGEEEQKVLAVKGRDVTKCQSKIIKERAEITTDFGGGMTMTQPTELEGEIVISERVWEQLFNGKDLTGWGYKSDGKFKDFDNKTESSDKRYSVKDGMLVVNPGKGTAQLWTARKFPMDFVLRLEFRAAVNADSGLFLRGTQLQVRDYLVAGPYKNLKKYKPQDWNEIVVVVHGDTAHCSCNGELLEEKLRIPATGPIGLEADRGQVEYRNIRINEHKWKHSLVDAKPTEKQKKELDNRNGIENDDDLYPAEKVKVGHAWKVEAKALTKLFGNSFTDIKGQLNQKFVKIEDVDGEECAVVESKGVVKAKMKDDDGKPTLDVEMDLTATAWRSIKTGVELKGTFSGKIKLAGKQKMDDMTVDITMSGPMTGSSTTKLK
jgi:hypothetical protein